MTRRDEKAIAFFGSWMIVGLYLDGWAHMNDKPETFFTPWHGVLYSGFVAAVLFFAIDGALRPRPVRSEPLDRQVMLGLAVFVAGALGDGAWHQIFGIEVNLEALLSPTHLALMIGGVLMLGGPVRAALRRGGSAPGFTTFFPTLVSMTLIALVSSFFLMYLSAFQLGGLYGGAGEIQQLWEIHGVASVLATNVLLVGVSLFLVRSWTTPPGAFAFLYGVVAGAMVAMQGWRFPLLILGAATAGALTDVIAWRTAPSVDRPGPARIFGAGAPLALWLAWVYAVAASDGIHWPVELVVGTVVLASLSGYGLAVLMFPVVVRSPRANANEPAVLGAQDVPLRS